MPIYFFKFNRINEKTSGVLWQSTLQNSTFWSILLRENAIDWAAEANSPFASWLNLQTKQTQHVKLKNNRNLLCDF